MNIFFTSGQQCKGSSLLEMLVALILLMTASQWMVEVYAMFIKQAKHQESLLLAQVEKENALEMEKIKSS